MDALTPDIRELRTDCGETLPGDRGPIPWGRRFFYLFVLFLFSLNSLNNQRKNVVLVFVMGAQTLDDPKV